MTEQLPVYLDNNATTRMAPDVLAAMLPFFIEHFGNASSQHGFGETVSAALRQARHQVASLLGAARDQEILFCGSGTEANNTAILSALAAMPERREVITSAVEHAAILAPLAFLKQSQGVTVHHIPVDGAGRLDRAAFRSALGRRTALVSIMTANNETGTLFPVTELAAEAHAAGALFHTDAVQAAGRVPLRLADSAIDMLSLSAHKLHGPKGVGALYLRHGLRFQPLLRGGHQERGRRAGTENVPGIVGLGAAAALAGARLAETASRLAGLRDRLEAGILQAIPHCRVNGDIARRLPNTSSIAFEDVDSEAVLLPLAKLGIAASAGSACTSGSMEPSHVLRAMRLPPQALHGAVRFSLSRDTQPGEIDRLLAVLPDIVAAARARSGLWADRQGRQMAMM